MLLSKGTETGQGIAYAWGKLREQIGTPTDFTEEFPDGLIFEDNCIMDCEAAGAKGLQYTLTRVRERRDHAKLREEMSKLPLVDGVHDRRLEAWCETTSDKFSTQWVTAFPSFRWFLTNAEFTQVAAAYLGLASPACLALVGKKVDRSSSRLDRYGDALTSVKQCARNGDKKYCGTQGDTKGPILRTLESLGDVKGLVWGAFGEGSIQCHRLASTLAEIGSQMHYKTMHVATPQIAKSVLVRAIRRDWGLAVVKANAHTILTNLSKVGNNVKAASERREALEQQWADEAADTQAMFDAFRGMRGGNTWWC